MSFTKLLASVYLDGGANIDAHASTVNSGEVLAAVMVRTPDTFQHIVSIYSTDHDVLDQLANALHQAANLARTEAAKKIPELVSGQRVARGDQLGTVATPAHAVGVELGVLFDGQDIPEVVDPAELVTVEVAKTPAQAAAPDSSPRAADVPPTAAPGEPSAVSQ